MAQTTDSTVARFDLAKRNEDLVMAENALRGEQIVAVVRLVSVIGVGATTSIANAIGAVNFKPDALRMGAVFLYALFACVATFGMLRRAKPRPALARIAPFAFTLIDVGYVTFMGARQWQVDGTSYRDVGAAFFALLSCFALARFSRWHVVFNTLAVTAAWIGLNAYIGEEHPIAITIWVAVLLTTMGLMIEITRTRTRRMFLELRKRDNLTRFLPAQVAERVMALGDTSLAPTQRDVTVMFTDIRDFTRFSETLPPQAVLNFLDDYFARMSEVVKAHGGIVNKFLGDGLLAIWGVPERLDNHAEHALRCALDMRKVVAEMNEQRARNGAEPLRIGIGIHSGTVAAGMLGGSVQHEYTVIGDAVNLTSRIEGLTKTYGRDVLVSESSWSQVNDRFQGERVAESQVKGRAEPVVVYSLDALKAA